MFLGSVLLVCCWLSSASLHVVDGPAKSDGSKVLGPVVLDLKLALYRSRLPAGQVDVADHLRTGLPIKLPKENMLQAAVCIAKAAFLVAVVMWLVGFHCSLPEGGRGLELGRQRAVTEAQPSTEPTECDLEMGLTPPTPSDADNEDGAEESECWGESEEESEDEDEEEPRVSNDCRDGFILQAATMGLPIRHCTAPEVHAEAGRVALARLDKKSGEQGDALDESDAASLLDPELVMIAAVKIIGGLMMSKICHGKGHWELLFGCQVYR